MQDSLTRGRRSSLRSAVMVTSVRQFFGKPLAELQQPAVSVCLRSYNPGLFLGEHAHERAHFCFVLGGSYKERVQGRDHNRTRDDLMFYPPNTPHSERYATECRSLLLDVKDETWLRANEPGSLFADPNDLRGITGLSIARRICHEMKHSDDVTPLQIEALVLELLVECTRSRKPIPCHTAKCVQRAEEFIRANRTDPLSLKSVADAARVHPSYLSRVFRKHQGMTVGQFIRWLRVKEAQRILSSSATPLAAIASECGFADQSHLFRVFRAVVGITPAEYRRQAQG
jgi:AraC family transcriptional regulator